MADYLEDLGVTAVELLPVFQKQGSDGGYWGYATLNFFAPEMGYSAAYEATGQPHEVLAEFQGMVDTLHQHGIEVILDVVFNHTGEGGLWREKVYYGADPDEYYYVSWKELAGIFSFRGFDNAGWYAVTDDGQYYWDNTGVGHDVRANNAPMKRLILDALRFYVDELHVDGFRFDLAAILGEVDGEYDCWNGADSVLQDIIDEPLFQERNIRIIAEPWSASGGYENCTGSSDDYLWALNGLYPSAQSVEGYAWAEWNNNFRDWWRRFVNEGTSWETTEGFIDGGGTLTGSDAIFGDDKRPYHSVNFTTVHDGFTMFDLFSYDGERNGCGPLNPVCCDDPYSTWCDIAGSGWGEHELDWGDEPTKRQLMRNLFAATLLSHGTPLLLGGDEWMRTQYGNNNAYSQGADNSANWFRWGEWLNRSNYDGHRMHDFVRGLIALRKAHPKALAPATYGGGLSLATSAISRRQIPTRP
jgi:glycogen operon protein